MIPTQLIWSPQRKGGDLRTRSAGGLRHGAQLGCCLALVVVPLLLLATPQRATLHGVGHHAGAQRGRADDAIARLPITWTTPVEFSHAVASTHRSQTKATTTVPTGATGAQTHVVNVSYRQVVPTTAPTTTTTVPVASPSPAPVHGPPAAVSVAVKAAPQPAPPAPKPVTPPAPVPAPAPHGVAGLASWYGSPAGTCASPTLAFGTIVTVTDAASGASVRCTVDDREADNPGRVIDLSPATFSQLASLAAGVIEVRLSW